MRVALIVNPAASAVTPSRVRAVEAVLRSAIELQTTMTVQRGHASELARSACKAGADAIVVFAGDGGFNEVLNGAEGEVPLGLVPGGGTSVLPRALGLPRDPVAAARRVAAALADGRTRRISVGRVNGRRFGFSAGIGLDAELVRRVDNLGRTRAGRRPGDLAFVSAAARALRSRRFRLPPALELEGHGRLALALVANCDPYTYAGPVAIHVAPLARFDLGLDIVGPRAVTPAALPRFLLYALFGRGQANAADVVYAHDVDRAEIRCDDPMPLQADGEDLGDVVEVTFEAERAAVSVLV